MTWKHKCWRVFCLALPLLLDHALNRAEEWTARKRQEERHYWEQW